MAHLILVRHSISAPNPDVDARNWALTNAGQDLCLPLANQLAKYQPDIIITSDEPKAIETGRITGTHLDISVHEMENLHEHERLGVPWFDSVDAFNTAVEQLLVQPELLVFGQETAIQALKRFSKAVDEVLAFYPEQNVVIVTHGTVMSLFIGQCAEIDPYPFWRRLGMPAFAVIDLPDFTLTRVVERVPLNDIAD